MAYHTTNTPPPTSPMNNTRGDSGVNTGGGIENIDAQSRIPFGNQPPAEEPLTLNTASLFGEIKFQRQIFSQAAFRRQVDTSFSELSNRREAVDIEEFFNQYNRLFFDIPKEGALSHSKLITDSTAYVTDYVNPLQVIVDQRDQQIEQLNRDIANLLEQIANAQAGVADEVQEEIAIGNPNDPNINWVGSFEENGLQKTFKKIYMDTRGNSIFSIEGYDDIEFESNESIDSDERNDDNWKESQLKKDINQAYDRAKFSDLKGVNIRTYSQWKGDIEKDSSGARTRDANKALDYLAFKITGNANFL
jgi:hypothetical protein